MGSPLVVWFGVVLLMLTLSEVSAREWFWNVQRTVLAPDGYPRSVIAVVDQSDVEEYQNPVVDQWSGHGSFNTIRKGGEGIPGTTLRVRQGERVVVHVTNKLAVSTISIHWHGLHQFKQAWADGTFGITECGIRPGETKTYDFTITQQPGTHWYHSHAAAQTMDGLAGLLIIDPEEGVEDPIQTRYSYTLDLPMVIQDWSHEQHKDLETRYLTRLHSYTQSINGTKQAFLADYPWPIYDVLINGRGQTDCKTLSWQDCENVRRWGWPGTDSYVGPGSPSWSGDESGGKYDYQNDPTIGQCFPRRPPLMGECNTQAEPSITQCVAGERIRLRLVNMGFSQGLRFWVEGHKFIVVARDGNMVEPNGLHSAIPITIGQRYDLILECNQDPNLNYKIFAMVGLSEFIPGSTNKNFESFSYGVLEYAKGNPLQAAPDPTITWTSETYRENYADWGLGPQDYIPAAIQNSFHPVASADYAVAPPAVERLFISTSGAGNWWNGNVTHATTSQPNQFAGANYEWWSVEDTREKHLATKVDAVEPFHAPSVPVLQSNLLGLDMYTQPSNSTPTIQPLLYVPEAPLTYEIVLVNFESQVHPWHTHGFTLQFLGQGWLTDDFKPNNSSEYGGGWFFRNNYLNSPSSPEQWEYDNTAWGFPDLSETVSSSRISIGDTFAAPPNSFTVMRITADNPGAWLFHCHMDFHAEAGQSFLWSVADSDGHYQPHLPPPPPSYKLCNVPQNTYGEVLEMQSIKEELELCKLGEGSSGNDGELNTTLVAVLVVCAVSVIGNIAAVAWYAMNKSRMNGATPRPWSNPLTDDDGLTGSFLPESRASENSFVLSPQ